HRLLIWLHRTTGATQLRLSGWLPLDRKGGQARLELPCLRLVQPVKQHTRLRLAAAAGLTLASVKSFNLQPVVPSPDVASSLDHERTFETSQPHYGGACDIQAAANAVARVLTFAEVADRQLQFTTTVQYEVGHGELRRVHLRLRNWVAEKVKWEADRVVRSFEPRRAPGDCSLLLELQPGVTGHYRVTLRGSMPLEEAAVGVLMPDVRVQDVERAEYKLAVAGDELAGEPRSGLVRLARPAKELSRWPVAAQRVERTHGRGWQVQGPEWQLRLLPHTRAMGPALMRIFLWEQTSSVMDGQRWVHESRCWLRHEGHTDLNVEFPAPIRLIAAAVDGIAVVPLQPGSSRLWLPLPGRAGVRCVRLRWLYKDAEPLDRPNLAAPEVGEALNGPDRGTVLTPAGWEPAKSTLASRLGRGATREGALALYRAEAQLRISQELCKQKRDSGAAAALAAAQRRFALYCLHARHALNMGANRGGVTGPAGQTLAEWLQKLQGDNRELAGQNGFEEVRAGDVEGKSLRPGELDLSIEDDDLARFTASSSATRKDSERGEVGRLLSRRGTPISWQARSRMEPPILHLTSRASQHTRQALAASGQWLGVLVVIWVLSFLPFLLARLRLFWPEQIALLGIIGWHLAGPTLIVLLLLFAALCGRVFLLARGLRLLFRKYFRRPSAAASGSAVRS